MAEPHCFAPLQVCAVRVAALTAAGAPQTGAGYGYVSDAVIDAAVGIEVSEGAEVEQKNGCGAICQTFRGEDQISRATVSMNFCVLDLELIWLLVGGDLFSTGGDTFGWQPPQLADPAPNGVCLELWAKAWDGAQQATPASTSSNAAYLHFVFPQFKATLGEFTLEGENFTQIPVSGFSTENANITINGPYDDWPVGVSTGGGITSAFGVFLDDTLPTAACGFINVTSAAS